MRGGAYSNIAIRTETRELSTPDARQAQALAFGTLRHLRRIDRALSSVVRRPRLDPEVEDFIQPQAGRIRRQDHRAMLQVWGVGDEALHLRTTQERRPFARLAR